MWTSSVYARSPLWMQNLGISLYGLKYRRERLGGEFERYVEEYRTADALSASQTKERVAHGLREILRRAAAVPYSRERWATRPTPEHFSPADVPSLPITPKQDLRDRPEAF